VEKIDLNRLKKGDLVFVSWITETDNRECYGIYEFIKHSETFLTQYFTRKASNCFDIYDEKTFFSNNPYKFTYLPVTHELICSKTWKCIAPEILEKFKPVTTNEKTPSLDYLLLGVLGISAIKSNKLISTKNYKMLKH